ncbi:DUF1481 domain-containing protein [Photobacterium sp. SDRW27]|uniref:DUF1481 domain-containing protein n=1 Tax=Photobacterium obscurum TaxID=2829490 RepID=UPI002244EA9B|nr:DUF1481 domain-containing protein [Photobacterium obscurum]MCW8330736.1 DUF1481 domain-containing protein [Photobacterium obscurum]
MKRLIPFLLLSLLAGCETTTVPENSITPILTHSGGQTQGDATSLYWYSFQQNRPVKLAEVVTAGDYGSYQSDYRWREGKLREIKRIGLQLSDETLKPFSLHVRYDTQGSAVFQRNTVDGSVLPLTNSQLYQLTQQADNAIRVVKQQRKNDQSLVQGYWQGNRFLRCGDEKPLEVSFQPDLSDFSAQQLSQQSQSSFMVVTGKVRKNKLVASQLLILSEEDQDCISPPALLDK